MSTLRANALKPITSGNSLVLQGDSGGSGVSGPSIDSNGDVDFSQNTDAKVKLPSGGGIYESDGSTEILTESGGAVSLKNTIIDSTSTNNISVIGFSGQLNNDLTADGAIFVYDTTTNYIAQGVTQSTGVITFPTAGKYFVSLCVHASKQSTTSTDFCQARVHIGSTIVGTTAVLGFNMSGATDMRLQGSFSGIFDLSANDTMKVDMSETGTMKIHDGSNTRFSVFRIGE